MAYIPTTDALYLSWSQNFSDLITADPARYGLAAADAAVIAGQQTIWAAAYALAINPTTRTSVTVADKDGEKVTSLQINRGYAAIIRANQGVDPADKTALGLTIPDPTPTPIPAPVTFPLISVLLGGGGTQQIFIADQNTPDLKAKPFGVAGCILRRATSPTQPVPMAAAILASIVTRADFVVDLTGLTPGQFVGYSGQWFNRKGQLGPIGPVAEFVIT